MWGVKNVEVIPVIVGVLGSVMKKLRQWIKKLGIRVRIGLLQKTTLLGTARMMRRVLDSPKGPPVIDYDLLPRDVCWHDSSQSSELNRQ